MSHMFEYFCVIFATWNLTDNTPKRPGGVPSLWYSVSSMHPPGGVALLHGKVASTLMRLPVWAYWDWSHWCDSLLHHCVCCVDATTSYVDATCHLCDMAMQVWHVKAVTIATGCCKFAAASLRGFLAADHLWESTTQVWETFFLELEIEDTLFSKIFSRKNVL